MFEISPNNKEVEASIIVSALIHEDDCDYIVDTLSKNDFYSSRYSLIFDAILKCKRDGISVDMTSVYTYISKQNKTDNKKIGSILAELTNIKPLSTNVKNFCNIIKDLSKKRMLIKNLNTALRNTYDINYNIADLSKDLSKYSNDLEKGFTDSLTNIADVANNCLNIIESSEGSNGITGLTTGLTQLDNMTGGLQPDDFYILAARPSMGKTSLALGIADHVSTFYDGTVLVISFEMSANKIIMRQLSYKTQINSRKLKSGNINKDEWKMLINTASEITEQGLEIEETGKMNTREIRRLCLKLKKEKDLKLIIIDYLQLMPMPKAERRDLQVGEITRDLKLLNNELGIPLILISQLNRQLEHRVNKRPIMSDLRESGAIEQDADLIAFVYRDIVYNPETEFDTLAELIIAKNRDGEIGTIKLKFIKEYTKFIDWDYKI